MSIPRIAIQRPVTMVMICCVVILLGVISLSRLPVDLLPDMQRPTLNVRVSYNGVGPLEMEELVTRPLEQTLAAVSGLDEITSTSSEGSAQVQLNFAWGTDLNDAADDVRTRLDRIRGRLPEDADPPSIFKFDPNQFPVLRIGIEGGFDEVTLREMAEQTLTPRLERVAGVASVTTSGGLRREIRVELSREKITALDLPVDRVVSVLRTENQNIPIGEVYQGDRTLLLRSQGQFESLDEIRDLVVLTTGGVPVYLKDIADVRDAEEDSRATLRINGRPGLRMEIQKQSGTNTVQVAQGVRAEIERINREIPGVRLTTLQDSALYIERAIDAVQTAVLFGAGLVVLIIFLFLRNFRSTLIVCSAIPICVIGTFALLYFSGMTLNTMTFGGLALGVGMMIDAAIVVLENSFRHMEEYGKDRVTAAIDGAEEVGAPVIASVLTNLAVFVPLLFLSGMSNLMFRQLSIVVSFALAMSLFVALTIVPVLCSWLLKKPTPIDERTGWTGRAFTVTERALAGADEGYRRLLHKALVHRPGVIGLAVATIVLAAIIFPTIPSELMTQVDEGEVSVSVELPNGTRIEPTDAVVARMEEEVRELVPEATAIIASAGSGGGFRGGGSNRGQLQVMLTPKEERARSSDEIAQNLRRRLSSMPGVQVRAYASGGNGFMNFFMSGGGGGGDRISLEIRGESFDDANRLARAAKDLMDATPGVEGARVGQDEGRAEMAIRVDRPKAALFGLTVTGVANTIRTNISGTQAAMFREDGNEYPIIVRLREEDREQVSDVDDILLSTASGQVLPAKALMSISPEIGPVSISRQNQRRITRVYGEPEGAVGEAVEALEGPLQQLAQQAPSNFAVGFGAGVLEQERAFDQRVAGFGVVKVVQDGTATGDRAGLCGDGVTVRVAARSVHHHVLYSDGCARRCTEPQVDRDSLQYAGVYRLDHACGHCRKQCDPAGGLHQCPASARRYGRA